MSRNEDGSVLLGKEREAYVARMFDRIAGPYDRLNRLISLGRDQSWRRLALKEGGARPGIQVADLGTGTGDLYLQIHELVGPSGRVSGLDIAPEMLAIARRKAEIKFPGVHHELREASAADTEIATGSLDLVTMAWVLRNVGDRQAVYSEVQRILKPGGRFVVIDMSRPDFAPARIGAALYMNLVMPGLIRWFGGDRDAYDYLSRSTARFPRRRELEAEWRNAGFSGVYSRPLMFGAVALHVGVNPANEVDRGGRTAEGWKRNGE